MKNNPYAKIKQNSILTASPAELTLMLYDGAIKFTNQGIMGINDKDYEKAHQSIVKAKNIIKEFQITLDRKYEVANDFDIMYDYIYRRLTEANIKKDTEILEEVLVYLRQFRDTWKEVMQLAKQPKVKAQ
jgi:flagellar protein FliS